MSNEPSVFDRMNIVLSQQMCHFFSDLLKTMDFPEPLCHRCVVSMSILVKSAPLGPTTVKSKELIRGFVVRASSDCNKVPGAAAISLSTMCFHLGIMSNPLETTYFNKVMQ
ncbi:hypothetical protein NPIL_483931 [Nephila pilipes]|uniref:Uncharacterized protein n=1 Tax=Nephila pilipes TaxID=299642 RepID=A0A8X6PTT8_NEPPI|nr:hypothetical protein NPIL_483931 [Nephila pilipes]